MTTVHTPSTAGWHEVWRWLEWTLSWYFFMHASTDVVQFWCNRNTQHAQSSSLVDFFCKSLTWVYSEIWTVACCFNVLHLNTVNMITAHWENAIVYRKPHRIQLSVLGRWNERTDLEINPHNKSFYFYFILFAMISTSEHICQPATVATKARPLCDPFSSLSQMSSAATIRPPLSNASNHFYSPSISSCMHYPCQGVKITRAWPLSRECSSI